MAASQASEALGEVVRRVLHPAVTQGTLRIERPFGPRGAALAASAVPSEGGEAEAELRAAIPVGASFDEIDEAVLRRLRKLAAVDALVVGDRLDAATVAIAAHLHDAICAFHPSMHGLFRGAGAERLLSMSARAIGEIPPPATVRGALLRHAWLGDLPRFRVVRVDVSWWTGRASFLGREPPARLLSWPSVRRVRREEHVAPLERLPALAELSDFAALSPLYASFLAGFFASSPLTNLSHAARKEPAFAWSPLLDALVSTRAGARLARRAITQGEGGGRAVLGTLRNLGGSALALVG